MTAAAVAGAIPSGAGDYDPSYPFTEPLGTDLDPYWDLVQQEEQPKQPVAGTPGFTAQTPVATQTGKPVADTTAAIAFADDAGEKLGADEALQTRFYQIAYAMPGAGRADVRARLDDVFDQTRALFFLHRGEDAWNLINVAQGQGGDERKNTLNTLADNYDTFLRGDDGYFKNPARYRYGPDFQKRLGDVSRILLKLETEPQVELWANDLERKQGLFVEGLFGGESSYNKSNRSSLITMNLTKGSRGYFSDQIHRAVQRMTTYYKRIGKTDAETFAIMARITSATPPDPSGFGVAPQVDTGHMSRAPYGDKLEEPPVTSQDWYAIETGRQDPYGPERRWILASKWPQAQAQGARILGQFTGMGADLPDPMKLLRPEEMPETKGQFLTEPFPTYGSVGDMPLTATPAQVASQAISGPIAGPVAPYQISEAEKEYWRKGAGYGSVAYDVGILEELYHADPDLFAWVLDEPEFAEEEANL